MRKAYRRVSTLTPIHRFDGQSKLIGNSAQTLRSLGEHLVGVLGRLPDHVEDLCDELDGHILVEEIAHRVHEDEPRGVPASRHV